jgi:excisionase family DNA binding protein
VAPAPNRCEPKGKGVNSPTVPTVEAARHPKRKRHPNYRPVKIHYTYTVEEIAGLFDCHRNTVRRWIKQGLPTIDHRRPTLIHGRDLAEFLQRLRQKHKQKCLQGQMYCVRCRAPRTPAGDMADYQPLTSALGNLVGICPSCESMMYRRVSLAKIGLIRGQLDVTMPQA